MLLQRRVFAAVRCGGVVIPGYVVTNVGGASVRRHGGDGGGGLSDDEEPETVRRLFRTSAATAVTAAVDATAERVYRRRNHIMIQVCRDPQTLAGTMGPRCDEQDHLKVDVKDTFKIERPQPKYADGRRTSAPAILWSAANLIEDKPTTSTVDSISLLQRLLERQRVLASHMNNDTSSPDSGIGLDHSMDSTEHMHMDAPTTVLHAQASVITSAMSSNSQKQTPLHHPTATNQNLPISPFLWPWINGE
ncbi:hypothetical protein RB195_008715 [Necator americanus]|uniref:Uncharacterized protein n=1 Tax=Necator americanus TaxID=51031 RepID=A0ABR1CQS9_NECAM